MGSPILQISFCSFFQFLFVCLFVAQEGIENVVRFGYKGVKVSFSLEGFDWFALWTKF